MLSAIEPWQWVLLVLTAIIAGLVRGFAGFGMGMIFMPVAGQVMPPVWALVTMIAMDLIGPVPNLPRAVRDGAPRDMVLLGIGMSVALPIGIWVLSLLEPDVFRYAISITTMVLLVFLISGVRYRGALNRPLLFGVGALGGFFGGTSGLAGPPVIMLYMGSTRPVKAVRANLLLFLFLSDIAALCLLAIFGMLSWAPLMIGLTLAMPYLLANIAGAAMFNPDRETLYRRIAYGIIAVSALSGLPVWD